MAMNQRLVDNIKFVTATVPKNYSGAAGTNTWISMKNYNHCTINIQAGAWAGGSAAVTVNQATAVAGTSQKALAFTSQWTNIADTTTDALVQTAVTSNTFNLNTANCMYVIEIDAASLDVTNAFDCLSVQVASPGTNADLYSIIYLLSSPRYAQATPPTALVD